MTFASCLRIVRRAREAVLGANVTFFFGRRRSTNAGRPGPSRNPASLVRPPSLLSFGGRLVRVLRRVEDVLVGEAGYGPAQHAERVPAEVRPLVRDERRAEDADQ